MTRKSKIIFDLLRGRISDNDYPNWMKVLQLIAMVVFWIVVVMEVGLVIISVPVVDALYTFFQGRSL